MGVGLSVSNLECTFDELQVTWNASNHSGMDFSYSSKIKSNNSNPGQSNDRRRSEASSVNNGPSKSGKEPSSKNRDWISWNFSTGKVDIKSYSNISSLDNNSGNMVIGGYSEIKSLYGNSGTVVTGILCKIPRSDFNSGTLKIGDYSDIQCMDNNSGTVSIGCSSEIGSLDYNTGTIYIEDYSKVRSVNYNIGIINLGKNCIIDSMDYNSGMIIISSDASVPIGKYNTGLITNQRKSRIAVDNELLTVPQPSANIITTEGIIGGVGASVKKYICELRDKFITRTVTKSTTSKARISAKLQKTSNVKSPIKRKVVTRTGTSKNCTVKNAKLPVKGKVSAAIRTDKNVRVKNVTIPAKITVLPQTVNPSKTKNLKSDHISIVPTPQGRMDPSLNDPNGVCSICMNNPKNVSFQCGHLCCENCSECLALCHICQKDITQKKKLFTFIQFP